MMNIFGMLLFQVYNIPVKEPEEIPGHEWLYYQYWENCMLPITTAKQIAVSALVKKIILGNGKKSTH